MIGNKLSLIVVCIIGFSLTNFSQQNEFKVGIGFKNSYMRQGNQPYQCYDQLSETSPTVMVGSEEYPTSPLNVIAEDGFNAVYYFAPSDWDMSENNFYNTLTLINNHNLKLLAFANMWFVPNTPCNGGGCNGVNIYNNFIIGQPNHWTWNDPKALNKARPNYDLLSTLCYKSDLKDVIWGHEINGEGSFKHGRNISTTPLCYDSGPAYVETETPPQNVSDALGYFRNNLLPENQKTCLLLANHGATINDFTDDSQWTASSGNFENTPYDWDPQNYINQTNKPDVILEASYYQFPQNSWYNMPYSNISSGNGNHYLGKFKTIDYLKNKGFEVHAVTTSELGNNYPAYLSHYHTNNGKRNANWLWFQIYTSIIHGADGVWLYAHDTYDVTENELDKKEIFNGLQLDRFKRQYFSNSYNNFVSNLGKELRYLVDNNFLSSDSQSIIYTKKDESDPNCIVPAAENYIPSYYPNHRNEGYGLRYSIRTNGDEVIMIVSNPLNFTVTTTLDFNNIANPIIKKSYGVDILFSADVSPSSPTYKVNRNSNINLENGTVGVQFFKNFTNGKNLTLTFGPMDVQILKFKSIPPISFNNGWEKVWSNNGSGKIDGWNAIDSDKFYTGDFDGDGAEELLCVQTGSNHNWMTLLKFENGKWKWKWSNYGNSHVMLPYRDNFIVGDYNGDGKDELLGNDIDGFTTLFRYENNNWIWAWSDYGANHAIIPYKDKLISGDFDGDGKDEILGSDLPFGWMTMFNFEKNDFRWGWSTNGTNHPILAYRNNFIKGDFDGNGRDEFLGFSSWATLFNFQNNNFNWGWSTNGSNNFSGWNYPLPPADRLLIGSIDSQDFKDEIMFIQTGTNAAWAATKDFKTDNSGWNDNWFANPENGMPFINDWSIANGGGTNTKYHLIKAIVNEPEYLIAFRKFGCTTNNYNYLINMYKSTNGTNKSAILENDFEQENSKIIEKNWLIFPNPTSGFFNIIVNNVKESSTIEIYNSTGILIETIVDVLNSEHEVNLSAYSCGLYLVVLKNSNEVYFKKVNYTK